jgi:endonuclease/exonuclease/phosphatase family metal-dependent hydrolase
LPFDLRESEGYYRAMNLFGRRAISLFALFLSFALHAETFRVATYNLENYLDQPTQTRHHAKSAEAKAKIRESILAMKPDVIALQEMGTVSALLELRASLKSAGLDFPFWEHVSGFDTNIHVAVLSKFPFTARRPHTNETFLLDGRRFHVSRGFAEVNVQVRKDYSFTLISAHLKSKLPVPEADQAEWRRDEAKELREIIAHDLDTNPKLNLIVLGDFNDTKNSPSIRTIIGRGRNKLVDTRPAERNGDDSQIGFFKHESRAVAWTDYYGVQDSYSRIDYILLSPGMAREWVRSETYIPRIPNWGVGSDHRPLVATFNAADQ